ncbi:PLP-dependent aminotransferase family protein [Algibacillus agarilyticus]|uniref:aminotransferase-like domain-containing protein n=1 Tax=Algibacillus agarilyticus TaxID=2234133 RepID=UPI000DCFA42A|nr:PLP-dependent aminotransferase family protein [Algibacillus agarilyticus]
MAFKYEALAGQLAASIRSSILKAGSALPSLRHFAELHSVSLSTATKTYNLLEQQGLIWVKPQSGYFVRAEFTDKMPKRFLSQATLVKQDTSDVIFEVLQNAMRPDLVPLGGGCLPPELLPIEELQRSLYRAARRSPAAAYSYGHQLGYQGLRDAISEQLAKRHCHIAPSQLLITNGCLEAVNLAVMECTVVNDVVAIFTPCYSGLLMALKQAGRQILEIPCNQSGPDLDYLAALMEEQKFKALIFSAIAYNPLGFNLSVAVKKRLAALIMHYKIPSIEDDAFGELGFMHEQTTPVFAYANQLDNQNNCITYCSSFSKPLASGFRIGWLGRADSVSVFAKHKMNLNLTSSLPAQVGLADYLFSEGYRAHLKRLSVEIEKRLNQMAQLIQTYFPSSVAICQPKGGLFLWLEFLAHVDSMDFYQAALAQGISVSPGEIFSMTGRYKNCVRLTIGLTNEIKLEAAIKKLSELV